MKSHDFNTLQTVLNRAARGLLLKFREQGEERLSILIEGTNLKVDFICLILQTIFVTGAVLLKRESCLIQERSRRCNPDSVFLSKRLCRKQATVHNRTGRPAKVGRARRPACQQKGMGVRHWGFVNCLPLNLNIQATLCAFPRRKARMK